MLSIIQKSALRTSIMPIIIVGLILDYVPPIACVFMMVLCAGASTFVTTSALITWKKSLDDYASIPKKAKLYVFLDCYELVVVVVILIVLFIILQSKLILFFVGLVATFYLSETLYFGDDAKYAEDGAKGSRYTEVRALMNLVAVTAYVALSFLI